MLHIINKENELCLVNRDSVGLWIENIFFKVPVSLKTLHIIYLWCLLFSSTSGCKKCVFFSFHMGGTKMSDSLAFWETWGFKDQKGCLKLCRYLSTNFNLIIPEYSPKWVLALPFFVGSHTKSNADSFPSNVSYTLLLYIVKKKQGLAIRYIDLDTGIFLTGSLHGNESNTMLSLCQTSDL